MRSSLPRAAAIAALACALATAMAAMVRALALVNLPRVYPDYLYPYMLMLDLREHGLDLAWATPPAPLFFPDLLFQALAGSLLSEPGAVLTGAFALHVLGFWGAVAWYLASVRPDLERGARWIGAGTAVCAYLATWVAYPYFADHVFYVWHANAMLMGIVLSGLAIRMIEGGVRRAPAAAFLVLASLAALSDRIVAAQFLIPIAATFLLLAAFGRIERRPALTVAILCTASTILASLLKRMLRASGHFFIVTPRTELDVGMIPAAVAQFWSDLPVLLGPRPAVLAGCAGALLVALELRRRREPVALGSWLLVFCVAGCTLAIPLLSDNWTRVRQQRYLLPLYFLPFLVPVLRLALSRFARRDAVWAALAGAALLFASVAVARQDVDSERPFELYPPLVAELDRLREARGIEYGFGPYAVAKCVNALSRTGVRVNELKGLAPRIWISNADWFYVRDKDGIRWPQYDFIITTGMRPDRLDAAFGPPSEIREIEGPGDCGGGSLWLYDRTTNPLDTEAQRRAFPAVLADRGLRRLAGLSPDERAPE